MQPERENGYPMRINKYLAHKGIATRREADTLIERGLVTLNGVKAKLGDKVNEEDEVLLKGNEPKKYVYLAYHKPEGIVSHSAEEDQEEIPSFFEVGGKRVRVFPLGRLDKESSGLIILTNDGRATDRLLNPKHEHKKIYNVVLDKPVSNHLLKWISHGVNIENYVTKPAEVVEIGEREIQITLTEGKKHQIRRMCAALGFQVRTLTRIAIENIELRGIPPGEYREIKGMKLDTFLKGLGL